MLLQFDLKHIHKVNFYPSDNNFTQALLVLLVTNMISDWEGNLVFVVAGFRLPVLTWNVMTSNGKGGHTLCVSPPTTCVC